MPAVRTDMLDVHGEILMLLADLDRAAGRDECARERVAGAVALYDRKGDVVSAARARKWPAAV
jgi:hypothetical protein